MSTYDELKELENVIKWVNPMRNLEYEKKLRKEFDKWNSKGSNIRLTPTATYIYYFLEKLDVGVKGESVVVDVGTPDFSESSNVVFLMLKNEYKGILIDHDADQRLLDDISGFEHLCKVSNNTVSWAGMRVQHDTIFPISSLDDILLESELDLDSIICVDLDIDGGEFQVWEQSEILKSVRPPLVVLEVNWPKRNQVPNVFDRYEDKVLGRVTYSTAIEKVKKLEYTPVMMWHRNLYCISNECVLDLEVYSPGELFEISEFLTGRIRELFNEIRRISVK